MVLKGTTRETQGDKDFLPDRPITAHQLLECRTRYPEFPPHVIGTRGLQ